MIVFETFIGLFYGYMKLVLINDTVIGVYRIGERMGCFII